MCIDETLNYTHAKYGMLPKLHIIMLTALIENSTKAKLCILL